jgi:acetyl esterase/lipase
MDPLRDEGLAYAEALEAAGCKVKVVTFKGLPHGFYMFPTLKATGQYFQNVVDFVKQVSGSDSRL